MTKLKGNYGLTDSCTKVIRLLTLISFVFLVTANVSAQSEFFDNAFANAAKPPAIGGGGWVITAKVSLNASGKEYITARGPVTLKSDGSLTGALPMSIDNKEIANNTLFLSVRKSNPSAITLTRMIGGRPFLAKPAATTSLKVDPNINYLSGKITWTDGDRIIRVDLESEYVKKASPPSGGGNSGKPIGARYQIGGYMRVTNSADGVGDYTVELYGNLYLHQYRKDGQEVGSQAQPIIKLIQQDANNGFEMQFNNNVFIDAYDGDTLTIEGGFLDRDAGQGLTGDDLLFAGDACLNKYGVYNLYRITQRDGSMLCKGDQDSESADIRIFAKKIKDLY